MLTITKKFLKKFPKWKDAGWREGDTINMETLPDETIASFASHPPRKPGHA